jgi:hypothetical protein
METKTGFEPVYKALQASAYPLGHFARNRVLTRELCQRTVFARNAFHGLGNR